MSPELFSPGEFGLKHSRPTKPSDCYALGMVIYEVLSGRVPFFRYGSCDVIVRVVRGERPRRPRGVERTWFTDDVWGVLEHCWKPKPDDRPRVENVLRCLEDSSGSWTPLSWMVGDPPAANTLIRNSADPSTEGSTEESEISSPSQSLSLPPKGNAVVKAHIPMLPDASTALLYDITNTNNCNESRSTAALDMVGWG